MTATSDLRDQHIIASQIRDSEKTHEPVELVLTTDERVLARITDGIYRQPSSALRELISNAYDADATEVIILTDAPRFEQISVRDNGVGLSPEVIGHLVKHIGGSTKRTDEGKRLGVTAPNNEYLSPGGRQLIGKLGIGLFAVAQFTRHFLIMSRVHGDRYRTIADVILGPVEGNPELRGQDTLGDNFINRGHVRIWREPASEDEAAGTEIRLLDLLPRTRAELTSEDLWARIEYQRDNSELGMVSPPQYHIGKMAPGQHENLDIAPRVPWDWLDSPPERFRKLANGVRRLAATLSESVDLDVVFDRYLQTIWTLALSAPLQYVAHHPFDLTPDDDVTFFRLENSPRGQATALPLEGESSPRHFLELSTPNGTTGAPFAAYVDGIQLLRPVMYTGLPKTSTAVEGPLMFIGKNSQTFENKPAELTGGPLVFEAYLFWAPKIVPKQHQGVILRVGNASGALFDRTFMGYQVSEQNRTRQITCEFFIREGLDSAINIDRESFNYAHPHYQYIVKWLHSALRQLANKHKELGAKLRSERVIVQGESVRAEVDAAVHAALMARGVDEVPNVLLAELQQTIDIEQLRSSGTIVLNRDRVLPRADTRKSRTKVELQRNTIKDKKAIAIAQLLYGWGLLDGLPFEDQEKLIRDILVIAFQEM